MSQLFRVNEFVEALRAKTLKNRIILEGMVKESDDDSQALLFSDGSRCENWIRIPLEMIDNIQFLSMFPCKDHEHPAVLITLSAPSDDNRVATAFAELFSRSQLLALRTPQSTERGRCPVVRGACEQNEDGTWTRTIQTADCGEREEPCTPRLPRPSRPPGGTPFPLRSECIRTDSAAAIPFTVLDTHRAALCASSFGTKRKCCSQIVKCSPTPVANSRGIRAVQAAADAQLRFTLLILHQTAVP